MRPVQGEEMTITIRRGTDEPQTIKVPLISQARYRQELPMVRHVYPTALSRVSSRRPDLLLAV